VPCHPGPALKTKKAESINNPPRAINQILLDYDLKGVFFEEVNTLKVQSLNVTPGCQFSPAHLHSRRSFYINGITPPVQRNRA
jgi:hypothetical protein